MATVDAARAALVTETFARVTQASPALPGVQAVVVTGCYTAAGAAAYAARVAPLALKGLRRWRVPGLTSTVDAQIGETITLSGAWLGPLDGEDLVVVGRAIDPNTDRISYMLRGPA